ncbi:MAG: hypothetical protein MI923_19655 [Phycisphaerales bacterium]|nr:hypothetical protein [Phycisphaerales bacterium]
MDPTSPTVCSIDKKTAGLRSSSGGDSFLRSCKRDQTDASHDSRTLS